MKPQVTIAIPVYKRLEYLGNALRCVQDQDYPSIELIVSDNGMNGPCIDEAVNKHYARSYKIRRNVSSVSIGAHFNQMVAAGNGKYFMILADDDEISPNFVSSLVDLLETVPEAVVAIARQEIIDGQGRVVRKAAGRLPGRLSGPEFIRSTWKRHEFRFEGFSTFLSRLDCIRACRGYLDLPSGNHIDNALLIQLSLMGCVLFCEECVFRWRDEKSSHGWSSSISNLAAASRGFLAFLDNDPFLKGYASKNAMEWMDLKAILIRMTWETYFERWNGLYRSNLSFLKWTCAAFGLPFLREYYRRVFRTLLRSRFRSGREPNNTRRLQSTSVCK